MTYRGPSTLKGRPVHVSSTVIPSDYNVNNPVKSFTKFILNIEKQVDQLHASDRLAKAKTIRIIS